MTDWAAKRFWTDTAVAQVDGGFGVTLDGRALRTPVKSALVLPTRALAEEVAREWEAQEGKINPLSMPFRAAKQGLGPAGRLVRHRAQSAAAGLCGGDARGTTHSKHRSTQPKGACAGRVPAGRVP